MAIREKATGWRVPLIFCASILLLGVGASLLLPTERPQPALPETLLAQARETIIDLDNPEGKIWQDAIVEAATGFAARESKDAKLLKVGDEALAASRFDAAAAACAQMRGAAAKDMLLEEILAQAQAQCATLPWGVFAIRALSDSQRAETAAAALVARWRQCEATSQDAAR